MNNFKEYGFFNHSLSGEILKDIDDWLVGYVTRPVYINGELHNNIQGVVWYKKTGEGFLGNRPKSDFNLYKLASATCEEQTKGEN